ncbi:hypothetical protein [Acetobacter vaccinii]|uniref:Secreted protein n=1 Tax=Acetobacter vaccinii TaxID=2592655 RepID=A0A5C1YRC1_9PROT|nr:hypothetical protein [Acetobacter vaccinii]QEO18313.1 hypothetical protein FLP30_11805 [Acetobacter vaccinii]
MRNTLSALLTVIAVVFSVPVMAAGSDHKVSDHTRRLNTDTQATPTITTEELNNRSLATARAALRPVVPPTAPVIAAGTGVIAPVATQVPASP